MEEKQIVIIGTGKIGRGFVGRLFSAAGYKLVAVEIDRPLIAALNARRAYTVRLVDNDDIQEVQVGPVSALYAGDQMAVAEAIAGVGIMATSVGARELPEVAPNIAAGVRRRMRIGNDAPLNCLLCENLYDAANIVRELVKKHLSADEQAFLDAHVGFVNTVIGCMGPPIPPEMRAQDTSRVLAEPYEELPVNRHDFIGEVPVVKGMEPCSQFEAYTARKLYIHNCGHAVLAYLGYLKGYTFAHDAIVDAELLDHLKAVWQESIAGLVAHYAVKVEWLTSLANELPRRFANRALGDTLFRLGRDPVRKLGPSDRLVAPARLAEKAGVTPSALARGIAAALHFDPPQDPIAVALQRRLAGEGIDLVLDDVCHIRPHEPLAELVRRYDADLKSRSS